MITCNVCFRHCRLEDGQTGACGARGNENGENICLNYGELTSLSIDPIEKKPFARFHPGSRILSVGSYGCNLFCPFCQNYEISTARRGEARTRKARPETIANLAKDSEASGNIGVAFTYNEPMVGWEFVRDTAKLVREKDMVNAVVTNGSVTPEILREVLPYIDAFNIDLKGFTEEYYKKLGGDLETVKTFIQIAAESAHVELTTLIVPGENDSPEEMAREAAWIASIDEEIPLHITRFFPRYKYEDRRPTDVEKMRELAATARKELTTVMLGNV